MAANGDPEVLVSARPTEASAIAQSYSSKPFFLACVFVLQMLFLGFVALHRFVDGDEGFYLLASRLVLQHKKLYLDFLYEQGPLLPYVYALCMKFFGISWNAARLFAAFLTALAGTLAYEEVCRQTRNRFAGATAAILFSASTLIFGFFPVAKTYSLAGLLVFAAYFAVSRLSFTSSGWLSATSGLLFAFSVDTRSYLLVLFPLFLWWIIRGSQPDRRWRQSLWFIGGCFVGVLPSLYYFALSPGIFLFNNIGCHAIRSDSGLVGGWQQKVFVLLQAFLGGPEANGIQGSILFFVALGLMSLIGKRRYPPRFAFQIAVVIGLVSLLPTPVLPQYFCLCIPFLVVSAVCVANDFYLGLESQRAKVLSLVAGVLLFGIYLAAPIPDFHRYIVTGVGVPWVKWARNPADWKLQNVQEISQAIDEVAAPGEAVASFWPGYIVQTRANPFPGLETDYGLPLSTKLTAEQRARYHILSEDEIDANFAAHNPRIVVLRNPDQVKGKIPLRKMIETEDALRASLQTYGYKVVRSVNGESIWVYSPKQ